MTKKKFYVSKKELQDYFGEEFNPTEKCMVELNQVLIDHSEGGSQEGGFHRYGIEKPLAKMNIELKLMSENPKKSQEQRNQNHQLGLGIMNEREIFQALVWTSHRNLLKCKK